jgi:4-hydroxythreonine-4-phosphate dehydrogenase
MNVVPTIAITMGDPAGVGPEILAKALAQDKVYQWCRPLVVGDAGLLSSCLAKVATAPSVRVISEPSAVQGQPGCVDLMEGPRLDREACLPGLPTVEGGKAMVNYIQTAVGLALAGEVAGVVTCPINKALMHQSGYPYEGHTQMIAHLTGSDEFVMMLAGEFLKVALVTIHCPIEQIPHILTAEMVYRTIRITHRALEEDFGLLRPRLGVAALNPHAGEGGLFGTQETEVIQPAVQRAREEGMAAAGPLPADTLFHRAISGQFDAVVAMYHDQGLIPIKLLHFSDAVNITLGLPIIRTSVDHGTAYDIAGSWQADPSSLVAAMRVGAQMIKNRRGGRA